MRRVMAAALACALGACGQVTSNSEGRGAASQGEARGERADEVTYGRFRVVEEQAPFLAVHAALMPNGKVLVFGGSQYEPLYTFGRSSFGLWDPETETTTLLDVHELGFGEEADLFCAGHTHLADGRLFIAGGTEHYPGIYSDDHLGEGHFTGIRDTFVFDPWTNELARGPTMRRGRWYPTVVRAPGDHGVVVLSGHPSMDDPLHTNDDIERTDPTARAPFEVIGRLASVTTYPRAHLVAGDEIFVASPDESLRNRALRFEPSGLVVEDRGDATFEEFPYFGYGAPSVVLPYDDLAPHPGQILFVGGVVPLRKDPRDATPWIPTSPRPTPAWSHRPRVRVHAHATLLPTGDVVVTGGVEVARDDGAHGTRDTSHYDAEIFHPGTGRWSLGPRASVSRNYHSTALLLPDGRVWTAGGSRRAQFSVTGQPGGDGRELRIELFEPWYHGHPARPSIRSVEKLGANAFRIDTPQASELTRVVAIAPGSATHAHDSDQRWVAARITARDEGSVEVVFDGPPSTRPAGWYMLFVLAAIDDPNGREIPSIASWVELSG